MRKNKWLYVFRFLKSLNLSSDNIYVYALCNKVVLLTYSVFNEDNEMKEVDGMPSIKLELQSLLKTKTKTKSQPWYVSKQGG